MARGLSSRSRKLPELIGGQVGDIRSFLGYLAKLDELREYYIRDLIPVFLLQWLSWRQAIVTASGARVGSS